MSKRKSALTAPSSSSSRRTPSAAASSDSEEFVLVSRSNTPAVASPHDDAASTSASTSQPINRRLGTPAEEALYEDQLEAARKADILGIDLPPVIPPGHRLELLPAEKPKLPLKFFQALFRRAENRSALYQLYVTTALMAIVPLGMMGTGYYSLFALLDDDSRLMWSAFAGVLGVNIIAIGFGIFAYHDRGGDDAGEAAEIDVAAEEEAKRKKWEAWNLEMEAQEGREDRERLQAIREAHQAKLGSKKTKVGDETASDDTASAAVSTPGRLRSSSRKSASARGKDRATLDDDDEQEQPVTPAEPQPTSSRVTRTRSKKGE